MKVNNNVTNSVKANNKPAFTGFNHKKSAVGIQEYEFNFPFDSNKYDCYLEVFSVTKDKNGKYNVGKPLENMDTESTKLQLDPKGSRVRLEQDYGVRQDESFAYRYELVEKNNKNNRFFQIDAGAVIDYSKPNKFDAFNIVTQNGSKVSKGGAMTLILPDSYNAGWVYDDKGHPTLNKVIQDKAKVSTKTFANKLGGTLAGIEQDIPRLQKTGYTRIVSTPIFTDDSLSAHSYWNKNCMQMSSALGNIDNYASFQKKLFKAGINFVSDGAFVNEGLEGVHFKHMLKWGEKSPYYNWFRADGLQSGPLTMGVFPRNKECVGYKFVNAPDSEGYNGKKPTYIQIFDKRLVSEANQKDTKNLIKAYDKLDTGNPVEINNHDDTLVPYSFEIEPEIYKKNIETLKEYNKKNPENKILPNTYEAARFLAKSENFELEDKFEGGFETWDANTDIAKLNFVYSHADTKKLMSLDPHEKEIMKKRLAQKNCEVQDYVVNSGKYWTQKTSNILTEHVAQTLNKTDADPKKAYDKIVSLIDGGQLPKSLKEEVTPKIVENVLSGRYQLNKTKVTPDYKDLTLSSLMDVPLDGIELGDNVVSVLASPYITKRAATSEDIGVSRFEIFKNGNKNLPKEYASAYKKADSMYTQEMASFANEILTSVNNKSSEKLFNDSNATTLGKYVIPIVAQDIVKFAVIKAVQPNTQAKINEDGTISFDYNKLKDLSLKEILGTKSASPEDEAECLVNAIKKGIKNISANDKQLLERAISKRVEKTDAKGYQLAEMLVDRANAGLDWRIDAAKDIGDMDALRNENSNFGQAWGGVIDFWSKFTKGVTSQNPNAYLAAEVTDEYALHDDSSKDYSTVREAVMKLHQDAGMTTIANYSYFFTDLANTFGKSFTEGADVTDGGRKEMVHWKMVGNDNYLQSAPLDSILYSYTFVGNHDKPRALHCLALDMGLFHGNLAESYESKKLATSILKDNLHPSDDDVKSVDFNRVSNKAIAMADAVKTGLGKALDDVFPQGEEHNKAFTAISRAVADLANGNYMDTTFSADALGTKPLDVVIDMVLKQAEAKHELKIDDKQKSQLYNQSFEKILKPAMSKMQGMMGFLVSLPGNATLFAGDDLGLTGYEEKTKNVYLQCRSFTHWEWLKDDNKKFIQEFYEKMNDTMALRSRPELSALNDGAPYTLRLHKDVGGKFSVPIVARQSADGSMALSLFNANNVNVDKQAALNVPALRLDSISLDGPLDNNKVGLHGGLTVGTTFKNANPKDKNLYKVCENNGAYFIKKFADENAYKEYQNGKPLNNTNQIDMLGPSMILYHSNKKDVSFTGRKVMYNPQYNFVSANSYKQAEVVKAGSKLALMAR